jgi:hypothetical protein
MSVDHRRLFIALASVAFFVLAAVPAVVVFSQGWLPLPQAALPGEASGHGGSPEAWALFALVYLAWMAGDVVLLVFLYDRLGFHYTPREGKPREPRRKKRRRAAALGYAAGQERARAEAAASARGRRTSRPAAPDPRAGRPPRRPPSERGPQSARPSPPAQTAGSAAPPAAPPVAPGAPASAAGPGPAPGAAQARPASADTPETPSDLEESA